MDFWAQMIVTIIGSVLASSGLWALVSKRMDKKDDSKKLLVGIAYDRIRFLATSYVNRGWISQDEYEDLYTYLYEPYKKLGGNGSAERIMREVDKLPIRKVDSAIMAKLDDR